MSQRPYQNYFVFNTGSLATTGDTVDVGLGQLGIFDAKTFQNLGTSPNFQVSKEIVLVQGTPDFSQMPEGAAIPNVTTKVTISGVRGKIKDFYVKKSRRPQNMIVTIGYDGIDPNKTLSAKKGETKQVFIKLSGQPISFFYPDVNAGLQQSFFLGDHCVDECSTSCEGDDVSGSLLADQLIREINNRKIVGGQPFSKYVRATKLIGGCETPSGYPTSEFTTYTLTVVDDGSQKALGLVQSQYVGLNVVRVKREGMVSTYQLVLPEGSPAPDDFNASLVAIVPNCEVCPDGYDLKEKLYVYKVVLKDNGNAAALTTFRTSYGNTAIRLSYANGLSTYLAYSVTQVPTWTPIASAEQFFVGEESSVCVLEDGTEISWVEGESCFKAKKVFQLTLKNDPCGQTKLADLQAIYGHLGTVSIVSTNGDTCVTLYQLEIHSDNLVCQDCDTTPYSYWKFTAPASFSNQAWTPVEGNVTGVGCSYGVKLEAAFVYPERDACSFEIPYFSDPLYIEVGQREPNSLGDPCENDWAVTTIQNPTFPAGYGAFVAELEKKTKLYQEFRYNVDPVVRKFRGYQWNTQFDAYYDEVVIVHDLEVNEYGINSTTRKETFEDHFFFPEGDSLSFINAINSWLASGSMPVALRTI